MMQIGMICGFLIAYTANHLLLEAGLKEAVGDRIYCDLTELAANEGSGS